MRPQRTDGNRSLLGQQQALARCTFNGGRVLCRGEPKLCSRAIPEDASRANLVRGPWQSGVAGRALSRKPPARSAGSYQCGESRGSHTSWTREGNASPGELRPQTPVAACLTSDSAACIIVTIGLPDPDRFYSLPITPDHSILYVSAGPARLLARRI